MECAYPKPNGFARGQRVIMRNQDFDYSRLLGQLDKDTTPNLDDKGVVSENGGADGED